MIYYEITVSKQGDLMKTTKNEIFRYLGYRNVARDEVAEALVDEIMEEFEKTVHPKSVYKELKISLKDNNIIEAYDENNIMKIQSKGLFKNLFGCEKIILFASTLGREADMIIKRYEVSNMAKAAVSQACGAAMIEAYCDELQENIRKSYEGKYFLRPRFSPGYGDFDLTHQRDVFQFLDCQKRLALSLTDNCLMIPSKSVTAVIGLSKSEEGCNISKCKMCDKLDCEFRSE